MPPAHVLYSIILCMAGLHKATRAQFNTANWWRWWRRLQMLGCCQTDS